MKRLAISFSGGRSSAVMTRLAVQQYSATHDIVVTFANTGAEHPRTLDFVHDFEQNTGINVVWIEAEVNPEQGQGTRARVVTYETASRDGRPFEDVVAKYGVPGPGLPQCTSRLKLEPMQAYLRYDLEWTANSYQTAIGLRADEMDRINYRGLVSGQLIYPLIDAGITKGQVIAAMAREPWDLDLPGEHYGNCVTCWKKSDRKLYTIAQDDRSWFDLRGYYFKGLASTDFQKHQPLVHPVLDYNKRVNGPAGIGGEISLDVNFTSLSWSRCSLC